MVTVQSDCSRINRPPPLLSVPLTLKFEANTEKFRFYSCTCFFEALSGPVHLRPGFRHQWVGDLYMSRSVGTLHFTTPHFLTSHNHWPRDCITIPISSRQQTSRVFFRHSTPRVAREQRSDQLTPRIVSRSCQSQFPRATTNPLLFALRDTAQRVAEAGNVEARRSTGGRMPASGEH